MVPTLRPGDLLWMGKTGSFKRGQVVVFRHDQELSIKRIVGLPGDTVAIRHQHVLINDHSLSEPYVPETAYLQPQSDRTWAVVPGAYFVLGDARDDSLDSRRLGSVAAGQIIGVVVSRLWPPPFALGSGR